MTPRRWPAPTPVALAVTGAGVVVADQVTKLLVVRALALHETVVVIPGFFDLTHSLNRGGVWGLGRDVSEGARLALFLGLPALIAALAAWYLRELPLTDRLGRFGIAAVLGGAVGNLVDRVRLGAVVDFLAFHVGDRYWPTFNIADSAICVGIVALAISSILERRSESSPDEPG